MEYLTLILFFIFAFLGVVLIRNHVVYTIRIKSLNEVPGGLYDNLPPYHIMMTSPKQWSVWTFKQYKRKYTK